MTSWAKIYRHVGSTCVRFNVVPATIAYCTNSNRSNGKWGNHNAGRDACGWVSSTAGRFDRKESTGQPRWEYILCPASDLKTQRLKIQLHTVTSVAFCGCETWSFTLRGKRRCVNSVEAEIGPGEINKDLEILYNDKVHRLYTVHLRWLQWMKQEMKWAGHVASMEEVICAYRISVRRPDGKRLPVRRRVGRREDKLKWIADEQDVKRTTGWI